MKNAIVLALLCQVLLGTDGFAQMKYVPNHVGTWRYHDNTGGTVPQMTPAEAAALRQWITTIGDIIHATPIVSPPTGFDAVARYSLGMFGQCHACAVTHLPTRMEILIEPYFLNERTGKPEPDDDEPPRIYVSINDPDAASIGTRLSYESLFDLNGSELIMEPKQVGTIGGAPLYNTLYNNGVVIISRSTKPLWVPASREQYLRALIKREEMNTSNPPETRKYMADYFRKELTELPSAERASAAYLVDGGQSISHLGTANDPEAVRLVYFNPAVFDAALPRTSPQLIVLRFQLDSQEPLSSPELFFEQLRLVFERRVRVSARPGSAWGQPR